MRFEEEADLLRREIEALLDLLPAKSVIREIADRPFRAPGRAFSDEAGNWSILPLVVCDSICGHCRHAAPAAAAVEFFKVAADVFDDIEDQDSPESVAQIYGQAQAINLASGFLALGQKAVGRLRDENVDPHVIVSILDDLATSFIKACTGQAYDLSYPSEAYVSEQMYLDAIALKSACQLECASRIGALLATTDKKLVDCFGSFGHNLGMAAQITNDIQGILGATGSRSDIFQKRKTLPVIYALAYGDSDTRSILEPIYCQPIAVTPDRERQAQVALSQVGAIHYAVLVAEVFRQRALGDLEMAQAAGGKVNRLTAMISG